MNISTEENSKFKQQALLKDDRLRADKAMLNLDAVYPTEYSNWYKQQPYAFVFTDHNDQVYKFNLPISPSNLTRTTHFATNVITTMYGTIEEHSQQRYFDINISGTTGMAPLFATYKKISGSIGSMPHLIIDDNNIPENIKLTIPPNRGRQPFRINSFLGSVADTAGFARRTTNLIANIADQANDLLSSDTVAPTGISSNNIYTGYAAFHNFYKFLLKYKQDVANNTNATNRKKHPLTFICWKDNTQYDVAINSFQLMRDANDPMLYKYSISLRGYNLNKAGASGDVSLEKEADRLSSLGLSTSGFFGLNTSIKAFLARKARSARNVAYATVAVVKSAGK